MSRSCRLVIEPASSAHDRTGGRSPDVAFEVKLSADVGDDDVKHPVWLREQLGEQFADGAVLTTGEHAYRRSDGIAVVP